MDEGLPDTIITHWNDNEQNYEEQTNEILAIKSFYENTENFHVIQEASIDDSKLNSLQFKIPIEAPTTKLCIEIWIPIENMQTNEATTKNKDTILERTISGRRGHTQINLDYLPPIILNVLLPVTYPSKNAPIFNISCFWLNENQLSKLCTELDILWHENFSLPIIFTWVEWIKTKTIECLNIFEPPNRILITPISMENSDYDCDSRAQNEFDDVQSCIYEFLRFNHVEELKTFKNSMQLCPLCFDENLGREFIRLDGCKHLFCKYCISTYIKMHVKDGTVQLIGCPENGCESEISDDIMQIILNDEEYNRWQRLLLQRTLDCMDDIMYCPKCSNPIVFDDHAYCMKCHLDFCKSCKDVWHAGPCLTNEEKIKKQIENLHIDMNKLLEMSDQQIKANFKNSQFVFEVKKKTLEQSTASTDILSKYKRCPKCKAPIEKIEGCNKVTCICRTILCYICGKIITGYEHFSDTRCNLWSTTNDVGNRVPERELHVGQRAMQRIINLLPNERRNIIQCPTCGQECLKMQRNNHIKCWLCRTNFCFSCKTKITGVITSHFRKGICKQHSD